MDKKYMYLNFLNPLKTSLIHAKCNSLNKGHMVDFHVEENNINASR